MQIAQTQNNQNSKIDLKTFSLYYEAEARNNVFFSVHEQMLMKRKANKKLKDSSYIAIRQSPI